ncbi:CBS domain-containing protein, partial [Klebsiella pneumoniae]|uniref:CBS domain-containing protein n=1 Tax=Klebsiella pneumoniae TaxID=573 RepID=UPI0034D26694
MDHREIGIRDALAESTLRRVAVPVLEGPAEGVAAIETGDHHAYPVVDGAGRPVGLVSRGDALGQGQVGIQGLDRAGHDRLD